jgi:transcriptional regulator with XRE-family HTH domain
VVAPASDREALGMARMELGEKLRRLREAEGLRRGLWRPLTQRETVRALRQELGVTLSQAYLSQLESGARVHLSHETREALARFYHIRPNDLASDPPGQERLDASGPQDEAERALHRLAAALAQSPDPQRALRLAERLFALGPEALAALEATLERQASAPHDADRDTTE